MVTTRFVGHATVPWLVIAGLLLGGGGLQAQSVPWKERWQLSFNSPAPTSPERLAKATVFLVRGAEYDPVTRKLSVHAWDTIDGRPGGTPLCDPNDPFYGQATSGWKASGVLIGQNQVLAAGHSMCQYPTGSACSDVWVVFDYAALDATHPLNGPAPPSGVIQFPVHNVRRCSQVLFNTYSSCPFGDDEIFGQPPQTPLSTDWVVFELEQDAPLGRIPLPYSVIPPAPDTPVAMLGHPGRVPMKGELSVVSQASSAANPAADFHALPGSSGSPLVSLDTGKLIGTAVSTAWPMWAPLVGSCRNPCFECPPVNVNFTPAAAALSVAEPEGLQLDPAVELVSHYGPPTTPADFENWPATVLSSIDSRTVDWSVSQDEGGPLLIEVVAGSTGGTLPAGGEESLQLAPTIDAVSTPGVHVATTSFYDWTYGTRAPVRHEIHVGVDGFTLSPATPLVGEGPGAPHGTTGFQSAGNLWIPRQSVTVSTDEPWIKLDGTAGPTSVSASLPGKFTDEAPPEVPIQLDGSGMYPDVYVGEVTVASEESGLPFSLSRDVRLDLCREIFAYANVPEQVIVTPEQPYIATVDLSPPPHLPPGPHTVRDVDAAVRLGLGSPGLGSDGRIDISLAKVGGSTVLLADSPFNVDAVYDDETFPPLGSLGDFLGSNPWGQWQLRIELQKGATGTFNATLHRFEVRLHVDPSLPCV